MASTRAYLITLASVVPHFARARLALIWIAAAVAFLVVVQMLWGPPAGIVVQGALLGGLSALLALGLALVYRANRILNFAQGDLGAAPASLAVLLVVTSGAHRVDEAKVATLVGEPLERADAAFVRAETGFAIGGVAPIGHTGAVVTLIDEHLLTFEEIWAAAGHPNMVFRLTPDDLVTMTQGRVAAVS